MCKPVGLRIQRMMSVVMTVEHPTKAFSRFCLEVILLCLGLKPILAWNPAESVRQKWMVILYLKSFSALKFVCQWPCSESDLGDSRCEWHCEKKREVDLILCIRGAKLRSDTRKCDIRIAKRALVLLFALFPTLHNSLLLKICKIW